MRKIVFSLLMACALSASMPAMAETSLFPGDPVIIDAPLIRVEDIKPMPIPTLEVIQPVASPETCPMPAPTLAPIPEAENNICFVAYYLTERDMGPDEGAICQGLKSIVKEYNLGDGTHHLRSTLDTSFPDERATVVIEGGQATLTGPYFSRAYVIALS